ncbi:MAG: proton-conducting transporter membrane subunit, partial [Acidimicrobiales bacterium]
QPILWAVAVLTLLVGAVLALVQRDIKRMLAYSSINHAGFILLGILLMGVGFAFKVSAAPFHMWTPDVYQGAPSPVTGFMAAVAKAGAFAAFLRVFVSSFGVLRADWQPVIYGVAVVTLLLGAGLAVVQRDIKRMLAYSSINHAGFVLLGLQVATGRGVSDALYYLFAYTFMVIGSFAVVSMVGRAGDVAHDISSYRGLARRQPLLALCFAVLLLAQAGVPFTTGLWAKLQVVLAAVDGHSVPLGLIAMFSAAVAAFFYLRVAVLMYTPPPSAGTALGREEPAEQPIALTAGTVGTFDPGIAPTAAPPVVPAAAGAAARPARPVWAGTEQSVAVVDRLNAGLLLDAETVTVDGETPAVAAADQVAGDVERVRVPDPALVDRVPVPALSALAVGLCVGVTVVFGIFPSPLVDFAHHATLLFVP